MCETPNPKTEGVENKNENILKMILVDVYVSGIRMIATLSSKLSSVKHYEQKHLSALLSFTYKARSINP